MPYCIWTLFHVSVHLSWMSFQEESDWWWKCWQSPSFCSHIICIRLIFLWGFSWYPIQWPDWSSGRSQWDHIIVLKALCEIFLHETQSAEFEALYPELFKKPPPCMWFLIYVTPFFEGIWESSPTASLLRSPRLSFFNILSSFWNTLC